MARVYEPVYLSPEDNCVVLKGGVVGILVGIPEGHPTHLIFVLMLTAQKA